MSGIISNIGMLDPDIRTAKGAHRGTEPRSGCVQFMVAAYPLGRPVEQLFQSVEAVEQTFSIEEEDSVTSSWFRLIVAR